MLIAFWRSTVASPVVRFMTFDKREFSRLPLCHVSEEMRHSPASSLKRSGKRQFFKTTPASSDEDEEPGSVMIVPIFFLMNNFRAPVTAV
jgi:hypothetical protein